MISLVPPPARSSVSSFGEGNVVAPLNPLANQLPIRVRKAYTPCQMSVHRTPVRQAHKRFTSNATRFVGSRANCCLGFNGLLERPQPQ
jgi:hypothetical protein